MIRLVYFLKKCYYSNIHRPNEDRWIDVLGKFLLLILIFVLLILIYSFWAWIGFNVLVRILMVLIPNNQVLFQEWIWIVYGLVLGLAVSVLFQAVPSTSKSIQFVLASSMRQFLFFTVFVLALFVWFLILSIAHFIRLV
jgi:hypothetical protein